MQCHCKQYVHRLGSHNNVRHCKNIANNIMVKSRLTKYAWGQHLHAIRAAVLATPSISRLEFVSCCAAHLTAQQGKEFSFLSKKFFSGVFCEGML